MLSSVVLSFSSFFGCFATEKGADIWFSDGQVSGMRDVGSFGKKARSHDTLTVDSPTVFRPRMLRVNFAETCRHLIAFAVGQFGLRRMLRFRIADSKHPRRGA